ncbi:ATP-binding protein [Myxococcus faecalis]|uniref:ATP-binding protein n=1 Tax=Myxococcus faecalis TaxID=3115646 RepID=UPI003CEB5A66
MKNQDQVEQILQHHLLDKAGKTILLSGPWGCGKTFLWSTRVAPKLETERPITLSLFGIDSLAALKVALMNASLIRRAASLNAKEYQAALKKDFGKLLGAGIRKGVDLFLGTTFLSSHLDPVHLVEDGLIICLDDLERAPSSLSLKEIFGFTALLTETKKARVLLITNETALAENDKESDTVLRQYKERVAQYQITLEADIDTTYTLFAKHWESNPQIHALLIRDQFGIMEIFNQSKWTNLRTLSKIMTGISELARVIGAANIKTEHTLLLATLRIESDSGSLQAGDFYDFNKLTAFGLSEESRTQLNDSRIAFIERYYGKISKAKYSFNLATYNFIRNGYFTEKQTREELLPLTRQLSATEQILHDSRNGISLFWGDTELAEFSTRIEAALTSPEPKNSIQLFSLYIHLAQTLRRIDQAPSDQTKELFKRKAIAQARLLDASFDRSARMYYSDSHDIWQELAREYDETLAQVSDEKQRQAIEDIIESGDENAFAHAIVRAPSALTMVLKSPTIHQIINSWRKNRSFQHFSLSLIASELADYDEHIIKDINKLRSEFADAFEDLIENEALGISDRKRLEQIRNKTKAWASSQNSK